MNTSQIEVRGTGYYQAKALYKSGALGIGASVNLVAEPDNIHDKNAVGVYLGSDKLGHLPKEIAPKFQKLVLNKSIINACIAEAFVKPGSSYLKIKLSVRYQQTKNVSQFELQEIPDLIGVYEISIVGGRFYIGSSKSLKRRRSQHLSKLRNGIHDSSNMQRDFNYFGEQNFRFKILDFYSSVSEARVKEEHEISRRLKSGQDLYNSTLDGQGRLVIKIGKDTRSISDLYKSDPSLISKLVSKLSQKGKDLFTNSAPKTGRNRLTEDHDSDPTKNNVVPKNLKIQRSENRFYEFANGDVYEGDWVDGKRTGKGELKYANGDSYQSNLISGKLKNKLKKTYTRQFSNGDRYTGDLSNNAMTGRGVYEFSNGDIYEGDFVNGTFTGWGIMFYKNGDKYDGQWLENLRHGKGTLKFSNGKIYKGEFHKNEQTGKGSLVLQNGSQYDGVFEKGELVTRDL